MKDILSCILVSSQPPFQLQQHILNSLPLSCSENSEKANMQQPKALVAEHLLIQSQMSFPVSFNFSLAEEVCFPAFLPSQKWCKTQQARGCQQAVTQFSNTARYPGPDCFCLMRSHTSCWEAFCTDLNCSYPKWLLGMPKEAIVYVYGYSSKTDAYIVSMAHSFVANTFVIYLHTYREEESIC